MDEGRERDNTSRRGAHLRCPVSTSVQFSLRNEGSSSTYVCVKGERSCAQIFELFRTQGINSTELVDWFRVCSFVGYSSLHMQAEMIPRKFLHSLKVKKFGLWRTTSVCYVTLSLDPSGVNLCQIVKTVHKT
jgi:hypothetical protein